MFYETARFPERLTRALHGLRLTINGNCHVVRDVLYLPLAGENSAILGEPQRWISGDFKLLDLPPRRVRLPLFDRTTGVGDFRVFREWLCGTVYRWRQSRSRKANGNRGSKVHFYDVYSGWRTVDPVLVSALTLAD